MNEFRHKEENEHKESNPVGHEEPKREFKVHHEPVQPKKESEDGGTQKFLAGAAVIQIILLLFVAFQIGGGSGDPSGAVVADPSAAAPSVPSAPRAPIDMKSLMDDDHVKGDPNAPVTIVEFSDFECPFCARFYTQTLSQIDEKYIKTGKVKLVYRDFPLNFHPQAQKAAEAAECAGEQGKYFEMHDKLFENGVQGGVPGFKATARALGLNGVTFDKCLDSGSQAAEVQKDLADGQRAGIQGTPGFVINGQVISGAQPFQAFEQVIEAELAN
jgi:protein-disulfide isomerase